jgi:hypothetical protein
MMLCTAADLPILEANDKCLDYKNKNLKTSVQIFTSELKYVKK